MKRNIVSFILVLGMVAAMFSLLSMTATATVPESPTVASSSTTSSTADCTPIAFTDIKGHWAENAINNMSANGIISGYADGTFRPRENITRAEFAAIIVRALGLDTVIGAGSFSDISSSDWCFSYIETATAHKLINGYANGKFGAKNMITREQAMTILARAMALTDLDAELTEEETTTLLNGYTDAAQISEYAEAGLAACLKNGIISGKGNGILAPGDKMTRAEVTFAVYNLLVKANLLTPTASEEETAATDYCSAENWLMLPTNTDKDVDIFYLYPTSYYKMTETDPIVCEVDNQMMRANAKLAFNRQATAFETVGNIYAPYYRQADAAICLALSEEDKDKLLGGITKDDIFAAFDYYIENYNQGRPFILAGHSQGSNMLLYLLTEYMEEHPDVYQRMVAAYVIGYSVTEEYLADNPHLKFAQGAADTGVIISYNTQAPTIEGKNPVLLPHALVINPLTWTRDATPATAEQNLGSIMLNKDGSVVLDKNGEFAKINNFADATIDTEKGVLVCSTVDVNTWAPGNAVFGKGVFHSFDYPFYYYNIRANAAQRAETFLNATN